MLIQIQIVCSLVLPFLPIYKCALFAAARDSILTFLAVNYNRVLSVFCVNTRDAGCAISRATDLQFTGRGLESRLGTTIAKWPWASYLHLCASVIKQYNLVPAKGGWPGDLFGWESNRGPGGK